MIQPDVFCEQTMQQNVTGAMVGNLPRNTYERRGREKRVVGMRKKRRGVVKRVTDWLWPVVIIDLSYNMPWMIIVIFVIFKYYSS